MSPLTVKNTFVTPLNANKKTTALQKSQLQKPDFTTSTTPALVVPQSLSNVALKIIRTQQKNVLWTVGFMVLSSLFAASWILYLVFGSSEQTSWVTYLFLAVFIVFVAYRTVMSLLGYWYLKKSSLQYKDELLLGLTSAPRFLNTIFVRLQKHQVHQNWMVLFLVFYAGIWIFLTWFLHTKTWGFLHFQRWIATLYHGDVRIFVWTTTFALCLLVFLHFVLTIQRQKQVYRIQTYFGNHIVSVSDLQEIKSTLQKSWRRAFLMSLLIVFVVPFFVRAIFRFVRRK